MKIVQHCVITPDVVVHALLGQMIANQATDPATLTEASTLHKRMLDSAVQEFYAKKFAVMPGVSTLN